MENRNQAWVYCSIDAPEDTHGALKGQRQQLMDYAAQMGFEVAGSSNDLGSLPLFMRDGFLRFIDAVETGRANILLIASQNCLTRSTMQLAQFQALVENYGLRVYSPLAGALFDCQ
ncbi:recombinase family protein [Dysosmobacter welbionis]|uniref:recombinase family protein n=1 Tax=Dysosmobacter welbionis TaxID=2093857 RepID=UPI0032C1D70A